jgi:hypothetical protein
VQAVLVTGHDWINVPGWANGAQVQAAIGRRKLFLVTLINAIFPGTAVAFAFYFLNRPKPAFVADYWVLYCAVTLASAIGMWYVPYFFGTSEERKREFSRMYAGTRQVLPSRGDNPRPNLLHLCFHALFVVTFVLAAVLRLRGA